MDKIIFFLSLLCLPLGLKCEVYSATAHITKLIHTQEQMIKNIDEVIGNWDKIFKTIENYRDVLKKEQEVSAVSVESYVQNPINAFKLIKRLSTDVIHISYMLDILHISNKTMVLPTTEDFLGTSEALVRLQETYLLNTEDLSQGKIHNVQYSKPMSLSDCYELANALMEKGHHYYSNLWFEETLARFKSDKNSYKISRLMILKSIAYNDFKMDDIDGSFQIIKDLIIEYPKEKSLVEKKIELQAVLSKRRIDGEVSGYEDEEEKKSYNVPKKDTDLIHEALCRGESQVPRDVVKRLRCRYDMKGSPYLRIAPFKIEEIYLDPLVLIYHDIINNNEIEQIQALALKDLQRSAVRTRTINGTSQMKAADYRVSQVSWLNDEQDEVVARISLRTGLMAKLTLETGEKLQASVYGVGGHYSPHYDMAKKNSKDQFEEDIGNRIATVLFYLTDVVLGGGTAFTELGITVSPKKGSAVVWRNLLPSTEADLRTKHGACPVLIGSKWVLNKWFHQIGQEFVAPCNLKYQREEDYS